jgi:signal transduction histidine kinase
MVEIRDDGIGGADPGHGSGLVGLSDRAQAMGGTLTVTSPAGKGTALLVEIPLAGQNSQERPRSLIDAGVSEFAQRRGHHRFKLPEVR